MEDNNTVETVETTPSETGAEETRETTSDAFLEGLSDDYQLEEKAEAQEEATEENQEVGEFGQELGDDDKAAMEREEETAPPTFTLKHNGAEFQVTQEQIIPLAQKGMDYDRIREQRDHLLNDPTLKQLDDFAKLQGMNREQFIGSLVEAFQRQQVSMLANEYMEHRGLDEQTAYEMASLYYQNENAQKYQEYQRAEQERAYQEELYNAQMAESEEMKLKQSFKRLVEEFPELKEKRWDDFPEQVRNDINNGADPLQAYQKFVLSEQKKQLEIIKNNEKNAQRATGSTKTAKEAKSADPFLEGFLS